MQASQRDRWRGGSGGAHPPAALLAASAFLPSPYGVSPLARFSAASRASKSASSSEGAQPAVSRTSHSGTHAGHQNVTTVQVSGSAQSCLGCCQWRAGTLARRHSRCEDWRAVGSQRDGRRRCKRVVANTPCARATSRLARGARDGRAAVKACGCGRAALWGLLQPAGPARNARDCCIALFGLLRQPLYGKGRQAGVRQAGVHRVPRAAWVSGDQPLGLVPDSKGAAFCGGFQRAPPKQAPSRLPATLGRPLPPLHAGPGLLPCR